MGKKKTGRKTPISSLQRLSLLSKAILVLSSLLILSVSSLGLVFLALSMVPSFVAAMNDKGVGKCASKTVSAFNFMGVLPYLFEIWGSPDPNYMARSLLVTPNAWLLTYGAAALGWVMVLLMPRVVSFLLKSRAEIKVQHISNMQKKLVSEWGNEVTNSNDI